jgi:ABC-2 type transport system permease protein
MQTFLKMTWVEVKLFIREPITMVFTLALPLIMLYVLGGVFGNTPSPHIYRGVGAMNYYVPAYLALTVAAIGCISLPVHLASYRERGVLRRFQASSIPIWSLYGAQLAVTFIIGVASSLLLIAVATITYHPESPRALIGVFAAFILGTLAFTTIGLFLGLALPTARAAQGAGLLLWFTMMMISGTGPPLEVLPSSLRTLGDVTPLKHVVMLIQDPWLGFGWNTVQMLIVGAFLLGSGILAVIFARRG